QDIVTEEKNALVGGGGLGPNSFGSHRGLAIERKRAVGACGVPELCRPDGHLAAVVASVRGSLRASEAVLLQHGRIGGIGFGGIAGCLRRARLGPARERFRQESAVIGSKDKGCR